MGNSGFDHIFGLNFFFFFFDVADHMGFIKEVAVAEPPMYLPQLLNMLQARGIVDIYLFEIIDKHLFF